MRVVFLYPPSQYLNHSMFKHYTYFAETIEIVSRRMKDVIILDCAVEMKSRDEIYAAFRDADYLITVVEPYNIKTAVELVGICKSISNCCKTIIYGTAASLIPNHLSGYSDIDYIIANGNFAEGIIQIIEEKQERTEPETKILYPDTGETGHIWGCSLDSNAPLDRYKYWGNNMYEFTVQVGCPFNCSFCSEKILFKRNKGCSYEMRPIEKTLSILKRVKDIYETVYFSATTFTYDRNWVMELCERMIQEKCSLPWRSDTRVDFLDEELLELMKRSGLKQLSVGVESLSDRVLAKVNKRQTAQDVLQTIQKCKKMGVNVKALLILGIPGQTLGDVVETQKIIEDMNIPYRWKEYSPIRELHEKDVRKEDISTELDLFSRNRFHVNSIEGLSPEKYMELLFPKGYVR